MKKFFVITVMFLIGVSIAVSSHAGDNITKPPINPREIIGKVISLTDDIKSRRNVWNFLIVGTSEHVGSIYKCFVVYVGNVNYFGHEIKQITYSSNFNSDWWQVEYYIPTGYLERESRHAGHIREESKLIHVLSIQ